MRKIKNWMISVALCPLVFAPSVFSGPSDKNRQELHDDSDNLFSIYMLSAKGPEPAEIFRKKLRTIKIEGKTTTATPELEDIPQLSGNLSVAESDELWQLRKASMHSFNTGINLRNRDGESGLDRLFESRVPVNFNFNTGNGRIDIDIASVFLSSGELTSSEFTNRYYGTFALVDAEERPIDDASKDALGTELAVGYESNGFAFKIGTTPLGFDITNITGAISYNHSFNSGFNFKLGAHIEPVKDSLLSYAGIEDPITGFEWGGIVRKGGNVSFGYDAGTFGTYIDLILAVYEGKNVDDNDFQQISTGVYFYPYQGESLQFSSGFNVTAFRFSENQRYFTFGHGGYFSPRTFVSASVPMSLIYIQDKLTVKLDLGIGLQYFYEEGADFYPSDPARQRLLETTETEQPTSFDENTVRQFGSTGGVGVNYQLSRQLEAKAQLAFSNTKDYKETVFFLGVEYLFGRD